MNEPLYKSIYEDIKKGIKDSKYPLNTQLPTDKEFAEIYEVSTITIKNAMDLLKVDGYISRKPRKGSHVISNNTLSSITKNNDSKPLIGLLFTNFNDNFGSKTLKHLVSYSQDQVDSIIKLTEGSPTREEQYMTELINTGVNGLIIFPTSSKYFSSKLLELSANNFPIVLVDRFMEKLPTCNVTIDNKSASEMLIKHLLENGHKNIGIVTAVRDITSNEERVNGAIRTLLENGISVRQSHLLTDLASMLPSGGISPDNDIKKIKHYLKINPDITAIFAGEYAVAILLKQAIEEIGKKVYKDISIVCFDHPYIPKVGSDSTFFTHVSQNEKELGEKAFDLLLKKMKTPNLIEKIIVPHNLVKGTSVKSIK